MRAAPFLLIGILLLPGAAAQAVPRSGHVLLCTTDCRPSDVNDNDLENTPVNVILYAHIMDPLQRAPLNVLPPDPGKEKDINQGFAMPSVKVPLADVYFENNWFYLFHLPRFVEYEPFGSNQDGPL